jgi:LysR family transcriptional regulator, regulator for genes of the gallate degradation pathway
MKISLRHLRIVLAVEETRSITQGASLCHVSQPAVSAAVAQIEAALGTLIFERKRAGLIPTPAGEAVALRLRRALALLDPALATLAPRLTRTATVAQLNALIAVAECESFSAAARRLNIAQPTVHRAISQLEGEVGTPLFDRTAHGVIPIRAVRQLAMAARLAFAEVDQAEADVGALAGREVGRVVIGAMPLARAALLGPAIAIFRKQWKTLPVRVIDGPYAELLLALRRGDVDMLVGALRPAVADLTQDVLFHDEMAIVARPSHPLAQHPARPAEMAAYPWVVAPEGTPARDHFAAMFRRAGVQVPVNLVETGSMALLSDLVGTSDHLGFISARQVAREVARGMLVRVPFQPEGTLRPIGLTTRAGWQATKAQADMLSALRAVAT